MSATPAQGALGRLRERPLVEAALLARPRLPQLRASVALGAGAVAAAVALMATSGYLISRAAERPAMLTLLVAIVAVRFFGMARAGLRYAERLVSHDLAFRMLAGLRVRFYERLVAALPGSERRDRGDLLSRFVADVESLQHLYLRGLSPPLVAATVIVASVVAAWVLLPAAALVLGAALLLASVGVPLLVGALARAAARRQAPARAELTAELVELIDGAAELAASGRESDWAARIAAGDTRLARLHRRDAVAAGVATGAGTLLANGAAVAVAAVAAAAVAGGTLNGVLLAALVLLALASFEAVAPLSDAARQLGASARAAERLQEATSNAELVPDRPRPRSAPATGDLVLEDVRARYHPDGPWVLDGANLRLAPGRRVALVGASGAGKTTLASLLVRFRDPDGGRLTLGGADLRELAQREVRQAVRLAGQDAYLFTASIADNVRLARPDATDADVESALGRAGLGEWIDSLLEGVATPVGRGGSQVSGGQRQRIALARVLLSDARFLICDEPAAHLDPAGARALLEHLGSLSEERGVLVISHVLAGLEDFDEILVLERGRIGRA
jgi:ATP-binding cassette, subfamily C, bacterial CydC